jgi:CRISPR system Cascade subunit CasD
MSTLLLRLAGPLQSWGADSKFTARTTRHEPTKSAILGLIAAAEGRRRTDSIEDLLGLRFGVRIDQPGVMMRDYHTARRMLIDKNTGHYRFNDNGKDRMPISNRYYLSDAVFLAGLEADCSLLEGIEYALLHPQFPLYLGRRSCPPAGKIAWGIVDADLVTALRQHPWQASHSFRRTCTRGKVPLEFLRDRLPTDRGDKPWEVLQDVPLSFSQERREYGWREVVHESPVVVDNPDGRVPLTHDPWQAVEVM